MINPSNNRICLSGEEALRVLAEIGLILVSLRNIGNTYLDGGQDYERELARFINEWQAPSRLATARRVLAEKFDTALGPDDMDDMERAAEMLPYWESAASKSPGFE